MSAVGLGVGNKMVHPGRGCGPPEITLSRPNSQGSLVENNDNECKHTHLGLGEKESGVLHQASFPIPPHAARQTPIVQTECLNSAIEYWILQKCQTRGDLLK